jgi:peptidoglycan/LPS O-acetylase OafA/YrhL
VISYHLNYLTGVTHVWSLPYVNHALIDIALAGFSGVTLFFILSGFLLFMSYARSLLFDGEWPQMRRFYLRRIFRIWPGYYISLVALILLTHPEFLRPDYWRRTALFLTFFMDSTPKTFQKINGPFWTLAVEWQFYMLLPLLALGLRWIVQRGSLRRRLITLFLALGGVVCWGVLIRHWGYSWQINPHQPLLLPAPIHNIAIFFLYGADGKFLEDFAIGMIVCVIYTLSKQYPDHRLVQFCRRFSLGLWIVGLLCLLFAATWMDLPGHTFFARPFTPEHWLSEMPFATGYGLCVLAILMGPQSLKRFWEWAPLCWLGTLSYGLYIWHLPLIYFFWLHVLPLWQHPEHHIVYGLYWLWVIVLIVPFCYLFYRLIELPGMKLGNKLTSPKS